MFEPKVISKLAIEQCDRLRWHWG